jgi:hypothetical protein
MFTITTAGVTVINWLVIIAELSRPTGENQTGDDMAKLFSFIFYYGYHSCTVIMANTMFSEKEAEYLKSQRIARIATAASVSSKEEGENGSLQPDVVPVGFDFDGEYLYVGGMNILKSTKYKNVLKNKSCDRH